MSAFRCVILVLCLLALPARAQDASSVGPEVRDVVFKGVVGKALDAVPMDAEHRVVLQRTNAVVSSTLTGRTLTVWAGMTNPILLIAGMAWGIFSASHIQTDSINPDPRTMLVDLLDAFDGDSVVVAQMFGPAPERDAYDATRVATLD